MACLLFVLLTLVALVTSVAGEGLDVLTTRGISDFVQRPFSIRPGTAGVYQGLVGTVTTAVLVAVSPLPWAWPRRCTWRSTRTTPGSPAWSPWSSATWPGCPPWSRPARLRPVRLGPVRGADRWVQRAVGRAHLLILVLPIVVITSSEAIRAVPERAARAATAWVPPGGRSPARSCCPTPWAASSPARSWAWPVPWARRRR